MNKKISIVGLSVLLTNLISFVTIACGIVYFVYFGFSGIILFYMIATGLLSVLTLFLRYDFEFSDKFMNFIYKIIGEDDED